MGFADILNRKLAWASKKLCIGAAGSQDLNLVLADTCLKAPTWLNLYKFIVKGLFHDDKIKHLNLGLSKSVL